MQFTEIIIGFIAGLVVWDMRLRAQALKRIEEQEKQLTESARKLSDLHNSAMAANQDLQNKVQSLEQAYRAQVNPIAVKRF